MVFKITYYQKGYASFLTSKQQNYLHQIKKSISNISRDKKQSNIRAKNYKQDLHGIIQQLRIPSQDLEKIKVK